MSSSVSDSSLPLKPAPHAPAQLALICGITGQDGAYLARFLVANGYKVIGTSRDASSARLDGLTKLGVAANVEVVSMAPNDFRSVLQTVTRYEPNEIFNLAGQTSVGLSFEQPVEAIESIALGTLNILEAIRFTKKSIRLYNAGSSECFGDTGDIPANECTPFQPRSPYAVAKVTAHHLVTNYRNSYGLYACTGILFNHESPLRPKRFVTQKIIHAAHRIASGDMAPLQLGNLDVHRDWGWAPDYVEIMWQLLQQHEPRDYVIATGRTESLEYFVEHVFRHFGLNWRDHVRQDPTLMRPSDIRYGAGDPSRVRQELGWQAKHDVDAVIYEMCSSAANGGLPN